MAFDALLKRYFVAIVLTLVAAAAYFQAAGLSELLGIPLMAGSGPGASGLKPAERGSQSARSKLKSADAILSRNPFDSVTGPLNPTEDEVSAEKPKAVDLSDPLSAPGCDGVEVKIVTESPDPAWSLAALKGADDDHPKLRRVGDRVGQREVVYIGYNPLQNSPSVWLTGDAALCQALMFAPGEEESSGADKKPDPDANKEKPSPRRRGPSKVPEEIASKIKKVSDTEYQVDRSVVDKILENQAELMRSARIVPEQQDGKVVGIRMFGVRPNTLLGTLGFQNGDRLETINGFNMSSPEKALEAYARLRTAKGLNVKINRRGKPMSIDFNIQ